MDEQLEKVCVMQMAKKVNNIDQQLHVIADNHLPHIYETLRTVQNDVNNLKGDFIEIKKKWNWKMWAGVFGVGISSIGVIIAFLELLI